MGYKMIITDMDDTLLNKDHELSEGNIEAIQKAVKSGLQFVLASGRPTYAMRDYVKQLGLDKVDSYYLSYNGAIISTTKNEKIWYEQGLSVDEVHLLYDIAQEYNLDIITYIGDDIVSETKTEYINAEIELTGMAYRQVKDFKQTVADAGGLVKCILLQEPTYLAEVEKKIKAQYGDRFSIAISKPFFLEVMKKDVHKGASLEKLAKHLDISLDEVIAVGDSYNDATMLSTAGCAVAVENAKPELKEMAAHIAPSSQDSALKYVIEEIAMK